MLSNVPAMLSNPSIFEILFWMKYSTLSAFIVDI